MNWVSLLKKFVRSTIITIKSTNFFSAETLAKQTKHNEDLQKRLNEALEAKSSVDEILEQFREKSSLHESNLESLHQQLGKS